jgi:hypothetical protein
VHSLEDVLRDECSRTPVEHKHGHSTPFRGLQEEGALRDD